VGEEGEEGGEEVSGRGGESEAEAKRRRSGGEAEASEARRRGRGRGRGGGCGYLEIERRSGLAGDGVVAPGGEAAVVRRRARQSQL
jgi:hypothetical protein